MKSYLCLLLLIPFTGQCLYSQKLPDGYINQYQQDFNSGKSLSDFRFDNPALWGIFNAGGNNYLQCNGKNDSTLRPALPVNIGIIDNKIFGDFVVEAEVMPIADTSGFREICLFVGVKDLSRYYYVQLANRCDSLTHGIYLVKDSVSVRLTDESLPPVSWKEKKWHKIRLERNIVKRTILVFVDDMTRPVLQIKDYELIMGMVGIGSFELPARFDNISIWAPTVITENSDE